VGGRGTTCLRFLSPQVSSPRHHASARICCRADVREHSDRRRQCATPAAGSALIQLRDRAAIRNDGPLSWQPLVHRLECRQSVVSRSPEIAVRQSPVASWALPQPASPNAMLRSSRRFCKKFLPALCSACPRVGRRLGSATSRTKHFQGTPHRDPAADEKAFPNDLADALLAKQPREDVTEEQGNGQGGNANHETDAPSLKQLPKTSPRHRARSRHDVPLPDLRGVEGSILVFC